MLAIIIYHPGILLFSLQLQKKHLLFHIEKLRMKCSLGISLLYLIHSRAQTPSFSSPTAAPQAGIQEGSQAIRQSAMIYLMSLLVERINEQMNE